MANDIKNILIVGAGIAGNLLAKDIKNNYPQYNVLGFIDDSTQKKRGVIGNINAIPRIIKVYNIHEIIVAIPSIDGKLLRRILLTNINNRIPIKIVPRNQKIIRKEHVRYAEIKNIDFDDFLGRSFINVNVNKLSAFYSKKVVLITGGAGSIGSEIVRQLLDLGVKKIIIYDNSEFSIFSLHQELIQKNISRSRCQFVIGSVRNESRLADIFKHTKPDVVFHAAAYKHVYLMEDNPLEAFTNNIIGTINTANMSIENKTKNFTFISTDKVVNPKSIMGASKKIGELYINSVDAKSTKFNIVRFGNVINSNGSVLPLFEQQIANKKPVTVTDKKMKRFFMSIREAANLVIESSAKNQGNKTYILNMGELINIHEVALCLIRSKNLIPNLDIKITIIGRKKGEKMKEQLYTNSEINNLNITKNPKIWELKEKDKTLLNIPEEIDKMKKMAQDNQEKKLKTKILRLAQ